MKKQLRSFVAATLTFICVLVSPIQAYAATVTYNGTISWDQASCAGTINGLYYGIKNSVDINPGDTVVLTLSNPTSTTIDYSVASGYTTLQSGALTSGQSSTVMTFSNVQSPITASTYPDPAVNICGGKVQDGQVVFTPVQPAPAPTPTTATPATNNAATPTTSTSGAKPTTTTAPSTPAPTASTTTNASATPLPKQNVVANSPPVSKVNAKSSPLSSVYYLLMFLVICAAVVVSWMKFKPHQKTKKRSIKRKK